jgi:GT2 family glycosyltransferase
MNEKTTIVIVNWNGAQFLDALLASVSNQNRRPTVVIDNSSADNSLDILSKYRDISVIRNESNLGYGSAANQGFQAAVTPYVLLLNVDVEVAPGAIALLENFMDTHPDAAVVAPRLQFPDGRLQPSCRSFPTILRLFLYLSFLDRIFPSNYHLKAEEHDQIREVEQPMGAALMFRKSVLEAAGGFDEDFFMYMEEVDLCERIHRNGGKIYFYPEARIVHAAGGSSKQDWKRSQQNFTDSVFIYFRKRSGSFSMMILRISIFAAYLMRSIVLFFAGRWRQSAAYLQLTRRVLQ